jgi:hypothetical protein
MFRIQVRFAELCSEHSIHFIMIKNIREGLTSDYTQQREASYAVPRRLKKRNKPGIPMIKRRTPAMKPQV